MIDLLYHATIYYKIRKFIQESEPATLTYELVIEKAKAHECNVLEYKDHHASHGGANSAPSYNNPLLSAHALSKRRPSGRGNNGQRCGKCGKSHERGNCLAYGKTCDRCKGINHFKAVCRSKVAAKTGFLALQFTVKCLKAPMLRVSPWRGCILTLTQMIGLRSLQMSPSECQVKLVP